MASGGPDVGETGRVVGKRKVSSIPMGDGWWSRENRPAADDTQIHPFRIETSDEEIQVRDGGTGYGGSTIIKRWRAKSLSWPFMARSSIYQHGSCSCCGLVLHVTC